MVIIKHRKLKRNFIGITFTEGYKVFRKNNLAHRYYGPAIFRGEKYKGWYFNETFFGWSDRGYNQKQFIKDVNKKWLS